MADILKRKKCPSREIRAHRGEVREKAPRLSVLVVMVTAARALGVVRRRREEREKTSKLWWVLVFGKQ